MPKLNIPCIILLLVVSSCRNKDNSVEQYRSALKASNDRLNRNEIALRSLINRETQIGMNDYLQSAIDSYKHLSRITDSLLQTVSSPVGVVSSPWLYNEQLNMVNLFIQTDDRQEFREVYYSDSILKIDSVPNLVAANSLLRLKEDIVLYFIRTKRFTDDFIIPKVNCYQADCDHYLVDLPFARSEAYSNSTTAEIYDSQDQLIPKHAYSIIHLQDRLVVLLYVPQSTDANFKRWLIRLADPGQNIQDKNIYSFIL